MKLGDLRKLSIKQQLKIHFRLRNGMECIVNEGVAQVIFFEADEVCETSYKDRGGKYQGQKGVTLPKI